MALGDFAPTESYGGTKKSLGGVAGGYAGGGPNGPAGLGALSATQGAAMAPTYATSTLPGSPTAPPDPYYQQTGIPTPPGSTNGMQSSDWAGAQQAASQQQNMQDRASLGLGGGNAAAGNSGNLEYQNYMSQFAPQLAGFDATGASLANQLGFAQANQAYSAGNLTDMRGLQGQMGGLDTQTIQNNMGFMREQLRNVGMNEDLINQMIANYGKMNGNLDTVLGNLGQQNNNLGQIHGMIGQQSGNLNEQLAKKLEEYQNNAAIKQRDIDSAYTSGGGWFSRFHGEKKTDVNEALANQTSQAELNNTYQQLGLSQAQIRVLNEQLGNSSSQMQTQNSQLGNTNQQLNLEQERNRNSLSGSDINRDLANAGIDLQRVGLNQQMLDSRLNQQLNDLGLSTMYKIDDIYANLRSNDVQKVAFAMQLIQQAIAQGVGR